MSEYILKHNFVLFIYFINFFFQNPFPKSDSFLKLFEKVCLTRVIVKKYNEKYKIECSK